MTDAIWIDASSGASGDMLLGALLGAGVPLEVLQGAIDDVTPEPVALRVEEVRRGGLAELATWAGEGVRGEVTIVVAGAPETGPVDDPASLVAWVADQ